MPSRTAEESVTKSEIHHTATREAYVFWKSFLIGAPTKRPVPFRVIEYADTVGDYFSLVPRNVLQYVFCYLPSKERAKLACLNQTWNRHANWWQKLLRDLQKRKEIFSLSLRNPGFVFVFSFVPLQVLALAAVFFQAPPQPSWVSMIVRAPVSVVKLFSKFFGSASSWQHNPST